MDSSQTKDKSTACFEFKDTFLELDIYRRPFQLLLPDQRNYHRTFIGSILSVITLLIILSYATYQMGALLSDYRILD